MQAPASIYLYVAASYPFNDPKGIFRSQFAEEVTEIEQAIQSFDIATLPAKLSEEKTMKGKRLYAPKELNKAILTNYLYPRGWAARSPNKQRKNPWDQPSISIATTVTDSSTGQTKTYTTSITMDGLKNKLGLEVQFGKYAFLGWDVLGKMPIFRNAGAISAAVEVVPMASMRGNKNMSTGIGCYEQIKAILEKRGASDLDIPVLLLGITPQRVRGEEVAVVADEDEDEEADAGLDGVE
jgi:hypothetical protein